VSARSPKVACVWRSSSATIRARVPLAVLRDTIQSFPTFSEIFVQALHDLHVASRKTAAVGHRAATGAI
jgi:hypothetical protein